MARPAKEQMTAAFVEPVAKAVQEGTSGGYRSIFLLSANELQHPRG
jgi:hypothetical protein